MSLDAARACLADEAPGDANRSTSYSWRVGRAPALVRFQSYKYLGGASGVLARFGSFADLASPDLRESDFRLSTRSRPQRHTWTYHDRRTGVISLNMELVEACAVVALCTLRLLELVEDRRLVALAAGELAGAVRG